MLTRLEVNGFKTFEKLDVALTPFTMVVGNNAAGKSNLFDVIQLLSNLATKDVSEGGQWHARRASGTFSADRCGAIQANRVGSGGLD